MHVLYAHQLFKLDAKHTKGKTQIPVLLGANNLGVFFEWFVQGEHADKSKRIALYDFAGNELYSQDIAVTSRIDPYIYGPWVFYTTKARKSLNCINIDTGRRFDVFETRKPREISRLAIT